MKIPQRRPSEDNIFMEEASGGEWKRYRGGSICALLSFGEDHVKNRIRHVLDYRKPPFWVMIGDDSAYGSCLFQLPS